MPFVELATGAGLDYEDLGQGDPLIVVHGRLGTAALDLGQVMDWLKADYRVLGPSLRGHGRSTPKPITYPLDFYQRDAQDVLAFMDALEIDRAHLLGYSDGGEVALICAGTQPQRFRSVTVIGAVGYYGPEMRPVAQGQYPPTWLHNDPDLLALHGITDPDGLIQQWIRAVVYLIDSGGDVSLSLAPNISAPLLMLLGRQDRLNPEAYARRFVDQTANGRLEMFNCGHGVHQEQWPRFQKVVGKFLKRLP